MAKVKVSDRDKRHTQAYQKVPERYKVYRKAFVKKKKRLSYMVAVHL